MCVRLHSGVTTEGGDVPECVQSGGCGAALVGVAGGGEALLTCRRAVGLPLRGAPGGGLLLRRGWCAAPGAARWWVAEVLEGRERGAAATVGGPEKVVVARWSCWAAPCEGVVLA